MKSSPENSERTADLSNAGVPSGAFLRAGESVEDARGV